MGFLLLGAECLPSRIISEYFPNLLAIISSFVFWSDYIFLLRLVLFSWFLLCQLSDFRLYPGHSVNVVDTRLSCVCLKNVDICILVSYCLGWTMNCLLDISSDVNSVYFIFESSLRLSSARMVQESVRRFDRVYTHLGSFWLSLFLDSLPTFQ